MNGKDQLTSEQIEELRAKSLLKETEYAYKAGDLLIAEDPTSGEKRIIGQASLLTETSRRVLKG
tara:strand:- start:352 stop:543 length:192 start_codon:yes stop_codon:yes gene_type:complete